MYCISYAKPRTKTTLYSDSLYLFEWKYFTSGKKTDLTLSKKKEKTCILKRLMSGAQLEK